jgi:choline-sulfatase
MQRTIFLAGILLAPLLFAAERPNVLLIIADDHAAYVTGAYGNKQVSTPNLDALAAQGMLFERAYCTAPVCTASRQSFLTGRYPRSIGVTQLQTALPEDVVTMADAFGEAGYRTAAIGKMHFNSALKHGFGLRLDVQDHNKALKTRGAQPLPEGIPTLGPWRPFQVPAREWLNAAYLPFPAVQADMRPQYFVEQSSAYLQATEDTPFFLMVSFYTPHSPFHFPVEFYNRKERSQFEPPEPGAEDAWQIPEIFEPLTHEDKQGITAAYYTSVEYMDYNVGQVLKALESTGQADNTIVLYYGDHGYFLGHHGRIEKHSLYEEAIRVPLIVRYPGHVAENTRSDAQVQLHDIFPTLGEYTGVQVPDSVEGKSFLSVLEQETDVHRKEIYVEYAENEEAMVRDTRWKLIYGTGNRVREDGYKTRNPTPGRYILLYDTQADPQEHHNLANTPELQERVKAMLGSLADHLRKTARVPEQKPDTADLYAFLDATLQPHDIK